MMKTTSISALAAAALCCLPPSATSGSAAAPPEGETWVRSVADAARRGKLQDAFQFVRGDSGKWSDEPTLLAATLENNAAGASLDDRFDQALARRGAPVRASEDVWLLFRTRQFDDNDRVWIERIERSGGRFSVVMHEAIWQGKYFKTFTFYQTYGINLGKLAPGKYQVAWTIRPRTFKQFGGDGKAQPENWPKDDVAAKRDPLTVALTFTVAGDSPKVGAASSVENLQTERPRGDRLQVSGGDGGRSRRSPDHRRSRRRAEFRIVRLTQTREISRWSDVAR